MKRKVIYYVKNYGEGRILELKESKQSIFIKIKELLKRWNEDLIKYYD